MKFFHFCQNNSGGRFTFDRDAGITHHVVIEAHDALHANARAKSIGLYFGGGWDCPCCGDRWSSADDEDGSDEPSIYDRPLKPGFAAGKFYRWMKPNPEGVIHYMDGRIEWGEE